MGQGGETCAVCRVEGCGWRCEKRPCLDVQGCKAIVEIEQGPPFFLFVSGSFLERFALRCKSWRSSVFGAFWRFWDFAVSEQDLVLSIVKH